MNQNIFLAILFVSLGLAGCKLGTDPLAIPDEYDGSSFAVNAATELEVVNQLGQMATYLEEGRDPGFPLSSTTLTIDFSNGSPSLSSLSSTYYRGLIEQWIPEVSAASGKTYSFDDAPNGDGGVIEGYLFDENGLELQQMIEKGMYGAVLYRYAISLMRGTIDVTTSDRLIAIFGAHPDFANSGNADLHNNPDRFIAKYAARRDPADGTGFYTRMQDAFILLQAATQAGADYQPEMQEALEAIQENWEKANAATVINYLSSAISTLSSSSPSDEDIAGAIHSYSEAVGFLHGWRTLNDDYRLITDDQIDDLLVMMNAPAGETPTSYLLVTNSFSELPDLQAAIDEIQDIYGFTDAEVAGFAINQVSTQGR